MNNRNELTAKPVNIKRVHPLNVSSGLINDTVSTKNSYKHRSTEEHHICSHENYKSTRERSSSNNHITIKTATATSTAASSMNTTAKKGENISTNEQIK